MLLSLFRFLVRAVLVLGVVAVVWGGYLWIEAGQMRKLEPLVSPGQCQKVMAPGVEDIEVHRGDSLAFLSSDDRAAPLSSRQGAIFGYDLRDDSASLRDLTADSGLELHPHGIYLVEGVASSVLYVVNHSRAQQSTPSEEETAGGQQAPIVDDRLDGSIEIFDWWKGKLKHRQTVRDPLLISPNDIAALDDGRFWVTNDHGTASDLGKLTEDLLRLHRGNVVFWDGEQMRIVAEGIGYPNGIQVNANGSEVFVSSTTTGKILRYETESSGGIPSGSLTLIEEIPLGTGVDNLERDLYGFLWVAAHPHLMTFLAHSRDPSRRSPIEGLWVSPEEPADPEAPRVRPAFLTLGEELSGASVVVPFGSRLLIGSVFEPFFLVCER